MTTILPLQNPPRIRGGFETIVAPLLGQDGQPLATDEWRQGVQGQTLPTTEFFTNSMIGGSWGDPDDGDLKPESVMGDEVAFKPSGVGVNFMCQMNAPGGARGDMAATLVRQEINRRLWSEIARHIQNVGTSIDCPGGDELNPTLVEVAQLPDGYVDLTPGSIEGVIQGLLDMVCAGAHTDPAFLAAYSFKSHFTRRGIVHWDEAQQAYILLGTHRIAFDCIDNVGPAGTTTAGDGSEVWIYALIPPQVAVADEEGDDFIAARAELRNTYHVRGERQFGYWFDTSQVYAAKAGVA